MNEAILFSGGTYQIEVREKKGKAIFWPFLQISDDGRIIDQFCSCQDTGGKKSCPHLEKALIRIFNGHEKPLHVRFKHSLWNALCRMACHTVGYSVSSLQKHQNSYTAIAPPKKRLALLRPKTSKSTLELNKILFDRKIETEETSLKFSNLSPEDLALWRQGRPTEDLRYELCFWSDIAKWLMELQENKKKYSISFQTKKNSLPHEITINFEEIECTFYIPEIQLPWIIPTLKSVKSPFKVESFSRKQIEEIRYLPKERCFLVIHKPSKHTQKQTPQGIRSGDWLFVDPIGFFPADTDPLLDLEKIDQVEKMLHQHAPLLQTYLLKDKIHDSPVPAQYHLFFDDKQALHIRLYLTHPDDFLHPNAALFGSWAYLPGHGFSRINTPLFAGIEKIIPQNKIGAFVSQNRHWLQTHEGFSVHMTNIDTECTFSVSDEGLLRFDINVQHATESIDCGEWLYIPGKGFYAKVSLQKETIIKPGLEIPREALADFISAHKEELELIPHFFSPICPIEKTGLHIKIEKDKHIHIYPEYVPRPEYKNTPIQLFEGKLCFIKEEGFYLLPTYAQLPLSFTEHKIISKTEESSFIFSDLPTLRFILLSQDPHVQVPETLRLVLKRLKREEKTKKPGWILELAAETELGSIPLFPIWQALIEKKRYLLTQAGLIFPSSPLFSWLKTISKKRWLKKGKELRITTLEWLKLIATDAIACKDTKIQHIVQEFLSFHPPSSPNIAGLKSLLRPYQQSGVSWLWFLYTHDLSGLLCDEMGLGKTHQAMGLLSAAINTHIEKKCHLIVCPTSVLYHWEDLLKRFLPHLSVTLFHGSIRTIDPTTDLIVTSYGMIRSEKELFKRIDFDIVIFDEIQNAKNANSQTHKALRSLNAKMRLGLTGTPIENHLSELKALFDLVLPGYFPQESLFRELFVHPIEKFQDPKQKHLLSRLIHPFILRRKKTDVLLELPEKIEEISYCDLSDEQKDLYKTVFLEHKENILQTLNNPQLSVPYPHIFSLLSKLKQICNHPCLFLKKKNNYFEHRSGKWDLVTELIQEAMESGLKVVIFSQYLGMLDIFIDYLTSKQIGYATIRGSTTARAEQLAKFRDDPTCSIFLASLQAAGVGIDLVSASIVIHYDRWWNPAKEEQATARVYRMGQKHQNIQIFKLVTKDTIEEHIHHIIQKKIHLLEEVIGFDEQSEIKTLDRQELLNLLALIDKDITSC